MPMGGARVSRCHQEDDAYAKGHRRARAELARRLKVPDGDLVGAKRRRIETRLSKLPKLYSCGDLTDEDSCREMAETRTMLAELPDPNKLVAFDRNRHAW